VGCIVAELLLRTPLFPGDSDLGQLSKIFDVLGVPSDANWHGHQSLPDYCEFKPVPGTPIPLHNIFTAAPDDLIELLDLFLKLDPNQRCSAKEALQHPYFR
jgi:cyclin-dependent kinase 7